MNYFIFLFLILCLIFFAIFQFIKNTQKDKQYYSIVQIFFIGFSLNLLIFLYLQLVFKNKKFKIGGVGPRGPKGDKGETGDNAICNKYIKNPYNL